MTGFLRNTTSHHRLVATLKSFSRFSNLQVNKDETEIFAIGSHRLDQRNYAHKVRTLKKSKKQIPPTAPKKFKEKFPQFQFDWNKKYSLPFTVIIETEIREFQYKVLNNIVLTNERLFR